ncbi:MAG: hypothetical protein ACT4QA_10135 [Panacagrimonas sp.]
MPEALLALLIFIATLGLAVALVRVSDHLGSLGRALTRAELRRSESERLQQAEQRIVEAQRMAEYAVAGGTELVRAVHRGIAAIPFSVLEAIPVTRDTARVVRKTHDLISDAVYGTIKGVNRGIGVGVRLGLTRGDQANSGPPQNRL